MKYRQTMLFSDQLDDQVIRSPALVTDLIPGNGKKCVLALGTGMVNGRSKSPEFQFVVYPETPLIGTSIQLVKEQCLRLVSGSVMITWLSVRPGPFGTSADGSDMEPAP